VGRSRPGRLRRRALALLVATALLGAAGGALGARANAGTSGTLVVDATAITRTLPPSFFGVNYVGFWDAAQGSAASAAALAQTPLKVVRFPGGAPGDWYDWQDPTYKHWSSTSPLDVWRYARRLGGSVLFQTNYQGHLPNPPGQAYAVNAPQNAAAWVAYNRALGISATMEVGNEEDMTMHSPHDPSFTPYITAFNAQARAMHAADPSVKVVGPAATNEWYWWALDSLGMFLQAAGNRKGSGQVDGVSLHFYKGSAWADTKGVAQYWLGSGGPWQAIQKAIRANDTRPLPVLVTEWNVGATGTNNAYNATLGHGLVTADMIGAFAQSGVAGQHYFDLHGAAGWGLLYGPGEKRPVDSPTPTYYALALWARMGAQLLATHSGDDPRDVSAYATRRPDGSLQTLVINKTGQARLLRLSFTHFSPRGHLLRVYDLRGATGAVTDLDAVYNGVAMPDPTHPLPGPRGATRLASDTVTYTLPLYSATVLDISAGH